MELPRDHRIHSNASPSLLFRDLNAMFNPTSSVPRLFSTWTARVARPMVRIAGGTHRRGQPVGARFPVLPGTTPPRWQVPAHIAAPDYAETGQPLNSHGPSEVHGPDKLRCMRVAARHAADALAMAGAHLRAGMTTADVDRLIFDYITAAGVYPAPVNYMRFNGASCTSVNEVVCHGVPDDRPLLDGDIISIDVSTYVNGVFGDTCRTFVVGEPDDAAAALIRATKTAMDAGIAAAQAGQPVHVIGDAIGAVSRDLGFPSVQQFCGHGIGSSMHLQPMVKHYANQDAHELTPGMTLTVEPMLVEGGRAIDMWPDQWTVVTADGGRAAQFEHTILITEDGPEILTYWETDEAAEFPWKSTWTQRECIE